MIFKKIAPSKLALLNKELAPKDAVIIHGSNQPFILYQSGKEVMRSWKLKDLDSAISLLEIPVPENGAVLTGKTKKERDEIVLKLSQSVQK